ncbi:MAG: outer membrane lipoprotein carrier protein LolA [Candidatus Cloacimonetes bacterium]|nr:outer membrane lipoprotein carrier protein LolA [Candidatus Cloacimonadota bacterium]
MVILRNSVILLLLTIVTFKKAYGREDLSSIYASVKAHYDTISTFQSNFEQDNYWSELDVYRKSSGLAYYNGSMFLLAYQTPQQEKLLVEEDCITIIDPASNQVFISDNFTVELRPDRILSNYWHDADSIAFYELEGNIRLEIFTPESEVISIKLVNYLIKEIKVEDPEGNYVNYTFRKEIYNRQLPEDIFRISIPADATIIDHRQENIPE